MTKNIFKEITIEFCVGLFFIAAMLILGFTTIVLNQDLLKSDITVYNAEFPYVNSLNQGDKVLISGVEVGRVRKIELLPTNKVLVQFTMNKKVSLYPNYMIKIESSSLLGGVNLAIKNGPSANAVAIPTTQTLVGQPPINIIDEVNSIVQEIKDRDVIGNIADTGANLKAITADINSGKGTLGKLIQDQTLYNEIQAASSNIKDITNKVKNGEGTLGKILNNDELYNELTSAINNFKEIGTDLRTGKGTIGKLLQDDTMYQTFTATGKNLQDITNKIAQGEGSLGKLLNDNGEIYQDIRNITQKLNTQEGTLGKLINDPALYDETKLGIQEFRRTVEDMREQTIWSSFGSFIFGVF